jgi:hypothetical protein
MPQSVSLTGTNASCRVHPCPNSQLSTAVLGPKQVSPLPTRKDAAVCLCRLEGRQ